jgi:uncharacterized membrane protein YedE/YeeE
MEKRIMEPVFCSRYFFRRLVGKPVFIQPATVEVNPKLAAELAGYGITDFSGLVPTQLFSWQNLLTVKGLLMMVLGGFLVGFGTRYAGGCTSGHSIMGLSTLQWPSLVATCCFMLGGFIMANFILPFILSLDLIIMQTITDNTDFEVRSLDTIGINESRLEHKWYHNIKYTVAGILFGILLVKSEVVSWFRIQEMFRLQSFHMYGVIGSAVVTGMISVWLIKKFHIKTIYGEAIELHSRKFNKGQVYGGLLFGFGWAITGACPGPLYAQIGTGATVIFVTLLSAVAGTWLYGKIREKLPH